MTVLFEVGMRAIAIYKTSHIHKECRVWHSRCKCAKFSSLWAWKMDKKTNGQICYSNSYKIGVRKWWEDKSCKGTHHISEGWQPNEHLKSEPVHSTSHSVIIWKLLYWTCIKKETIARLQKFSEFFKFFIPISIALGWMSSNFFTLKSDSRINYCTKCPCK